MISYEAYTVFHVVGILLLFLALGGLALHAATGGRKASNTARRLVAATHGLGLLIVVVSGFGLLARIGAARGGLPGWVWVKVGIWLLLGALYAVPYRAPGLARLLWVLLPILGGIAAYMAIFKPF